MNIVAVRTTADGGYAVDHLEDTPEGEQTWTSFVGADIGSSDYDAILSWVAAGNVPEPYVPTSPVPSVVEIAQARLALLQAGLLAQVDAAIAAMPSPQKEAALIEWEYRQTVRRDALLVVGLIAALGWTEQQVDELFTLAATL